MTVAESTYYAAVIPHVAGKRVLDVGSIGHEYAGKYKTWNFAILQEHVREIAGFDLLESEVAKARADGYDIVVGDAETYVSDEPYEVVFAGDLIEHLSNPGLFLSCAYKNLVAGGHLVITTPNTYSFAKLARVLIRRTNEPPVNPQHTCYYTPETLQQLISRHGFKLSNLEYCELDYSEEYGSRSQRAQLRVNARLSAWCPRFSQTMVAVFERI